MELTDEVNELMHIVMMRRHYLLKNKCPCPKCKSRNVAVRGLSGLGQWVCLDCHHKFRWEPIVKI